MPAFVVVHGLPFVDKGGRTHRLSVCDAHHLVGFFMENIMSTSRIVIAGQSSGVGKTTITLGLIAALRRRNLTVQPFKCGPDYIDPTYHSLAAERPCRNLDTWMLTTEQMQAEFEQASRDVDIAVIEGVMGLYDGSSYTDEQGSTAHIAKLLDSPVLLILDIGKLARSAGALASGYCQFDPALNLAGFILNRAGSASHADGCATAIRQATQQPVVGWLSKHSDLHIPERHLGLIPTNERQQLNDLIQDAADAIEATFDLDQIIQLAQAESSFSVAPSPRRPLTPSPPHPVALAVATGEAFSFYYQSNLDRLVEAGAQIVTFNPQHDSELPEGADGLYLGGGFPEVYGRQLSENQSILEAIRAFHAAGHPIYAECGGFMMLTQALVDLDGRRWPMAGIVPGETHMQTRLAGLGYRVATAKQDNLLLAAGESVRGHEFHYSTWQVGADELSDKSAWALKRRMHNAEARPDGYVEENLLASYLHIHFGQDSGLAQRMVDKMAQKSYQMVGVL